MATVRTGRPRMPKGKSDLPILTHFDSNSASSQSPSPSPPHYMHWRVVDSLSCPAGYANLFRNVHLRPRILSHVRLHESPKNMPEIQKAVVKCPCHGQGEMGSQKKAPLRYD